MPRHPAFSNADTSVYPASAGFRLLIAALCIIAAGVVTHLCFVAARWIETPPGLGVVTVSLLFFWAPLALFNYWDSESPGMSIIKGAALVVAVLALLSLLAAAAMWLIPLAWLHPIDYRDYLNGRPGWILQVVISLFLACLLYWKTLPAMLRGLSEIGLLSP